MKDRYLTVIALLSESESASHIPPLTLLVDGMLVSGTVISQEEYLSHHSFLEAIEQSLTVALATEEPSQEELENPPPNFLHLKNAVYCLPGQQPLPTQGSVYARISLHAISGFTLGALKVDVR